MIDYSNEIFTYIKEEINKVHGNVKVISESVNVPSEFPCVTIEDYSTPSHLDSGKQKYADLTYRVKVFSNKKIGKRAEAREIFSTLADAMYDMNLILKAFVPLPAMYAGEIYEIDASFEAAIDKEGNIYRR